ncbi:MAG: GAF domain-containing protein [Firmicutes bacterium]|nr:GAF domain-containing protein [Bacillota bacterium]
MVECDNLDAFEYSSNRNKCSRLNDGISKLLKRFLAENLFPLRATLGCALAVRQGLGKGEILAAFRSKAGQKIVNLLQNNQSPVFAELPSLLETCFSDQNVMILESRDAHIVCEIPFFNLADEKFVLCTPWYCNGSFLLVFWSNQPFGEKEQVFLRNLTWLLTEAATNIQKQWAVSTRLNSLEMIFNTTKVLTSEQSVENKLEILADTAMEMLHGDYATLRLVQRGTLQLAVSRGLPGGFEGVKDRFGLYIDDWTVRKGKTVTIEDITAWPAIEYARDVSGLKSVISVPMRLKNRVIGAISIYSIVPRIPASDMINCLSIIADQVAIVIEDALLMSRTALLQEVHHRVKNNLQMVAGLLSLAASSNQQSPLAEEYLQESVNRVKTMAIIHGLLSEKGEGLTDLKELINRLAPLFLNLQITNTRKAEIKVIGPSVYLGSKEATCLALAINELLCNSLKHGIVDFREGFVSVEIQMDKENLHLKIQDNGHGLTSEFDWKKHKGLGLKIVEALIEKDLHGTFNLSSNNKGALAVIVVPTSILRNGGVISGTDWDLNERA